MNHRLNKEEPQIMHIDLNSAFASAEQQAWSSFRGKPMGVTNRLSKECCVIAASYEAKALGIKVGTRRSEALALCPDFIMVETDPSKYTHMYLSLIRIIKSYSPNIKMKSIDEGIIDFHGTRNVNSRSLLDIGMEIKQRMRDEVGKFMRVNIGIAPNRFLAKTAAGLHKPDGMDLISHRNLIEVYKTMELEDISGIADGYGSRLRAHGITTPIEFLEASDELLRKRVFKSINGMYWHERLRGYEMDDQPTSLGMVGRQWVVKNPSNDDAYLRSCLHFLVETTGIAANRAYQVVIEVPSEKVWQEYQSYIEQIPVSLGADVLVNILEDGKDRYWVVNVDYKIIDKLGQAREIACIQVDIGNAPRLNIHYIDENGQKKHPVIIHSAIPGGIERYLYILFDNFEQGLPVWLSPAQIRLIPVGAEYVEHCQRLIAKYANLPLRIEVDDRSISVSSKLK